MNQRNQRHAYLHCGSYSDHSYPVYFSALVDTLS